MPRLPVVFGDDVVNALVKLGFENVRRCGSHVVMRRASAGTVGRLHREVKTWTLKASSAKRKSIRKSS